MVARGGRHLLALLATGVVIELALLPVGLWHFHRAGIYGSLANLVAIPLTTLVTMPLLAIALLLDVAGLGAPAWWLAGKSIDAMLALAHWISAQPGAVTVRPAMSGWAIAAFVAGGLWLALWRGRVRLLGLIPVALGVAGIASARAPDILVSGDGRHVGVTGVSEGELLVLREGRSDFARDNLVEMAGMSGAVRTLAEWPGARCSRDFCTFELERGGRVWRVLVSRSRDRVPERELAAACDRVDIVISDRWLPRSCAPRWLRADRRALGQSGGLAIDLARREVRTVAQGQGRHGWWRVEPVRARFPAAPEKLPADGPAGPQSGEQADTQPVRKPDTGPVKQVDTQPGRTETRGKTPAEVPSPGLAATRNYAGAGAKGGQ